VSALGQGRTQMRAQAKDPLNPVRVCAERSREENRPKPVNESLDNRSHSAPIPTWFCPRMALYAGQLAPGQHPGSPPIALNEVLCRALSANPPRPAC
jgi:hypothetical protein